MRIESCRVCGKELEPVSRCEVCHDVDSFRCSNCGTISCKHVHQQVVA